MAEQHKQGGDSEGRRAAQQREAERIFKQANQAARIHNVKPAQPTSKPPPANAKFIDAYSKAQAAQKTYDAIAAKLEEERRLVAKRMEPWQHELRELEHDFAAREGRVRDEEARVRAEEKRVAADREAMKAARAQLDAASARVERQASQLASDKAALIAEDHLNRKALADARDEHRQKLDELTATFVSKLNEQAAETERAYGEELAGWSAKLAGWQAELEAAQRKLDDGAARLLARVDAFDAELSARLPDHIREIQDDHRRLEEEVTRISEERDAAEQRAETSADKASQLRAEVLEHEGARLQTLGMTELEVRGRLDDQKTTILQLRKELEGRPMPETTQRMGDVLLDNERLRDELTRLRREEENGKARVRELEEAIRTEEGLSSEVDTFKTLNETYLAENAELRKALRGDRVATRCFPRLSELDEELGTEVDDEQVEPIELPEAPDLDVLVARLHAALAAREDGHPSLFYDLHDIQAFVAGLAMSRLHILEGDSGTGKTSLAVRATQLLGGHVEKIDVQAGWRDATRLMGAYNTFEERFEEEPCTVALYRAGAAIHRDQLFVVVLDELNLSAVEYYLADLSPKLEDARRSGEPIELELMNSSPKDAGGWPSRLKHGRVLTVPDNVWFIGTANRDESTQTIADKTYDRAAILHLERVDGTPEPDADIDGARVSLASLRRRFVEAKGDPPVEQMERMKQALEYVDDALLERFSMRWSPRFMCQLADFVPVYTACGGSVADAADHLLATKVLRRLRDRYGNRRSELDDLTHDVTDAWEAFGTGAVPARSKAVLLAARARAMQA